MNFILLRLIFWFIIRGHSEPFLFLLWFSLIGWLKRMNFNSFISAFNQIWIKFIKKSFMIWQSPSYFFLIWYKATVVIRPHFYDRIPDENQTILVSDAFLNVNKKFDSPISEKKTRILNQRKRSKNREQNEPKVGTFKWWTFCSPLFVNEKKMISKSLPLPIFFFPKPVESLF